MSFAINKTRLLSFLSLHHRPLPVANAIYCSNFNAPTKFSFSIAPLILSSFLHPPRASFPISVKKAAITEISKSEKMVAEGECTALIFTYGTLKQGFSNHTLLLDLIRTGEAVFIGKYRTVGSYPLVCGPYRVPFLINLPGAGHRVQGELYALSSRGLARTDELEGTSEGHYERLPIELVEEGEGEGKEKEEETSATRAEAYFAHRSYAMEMWRKEGKKKGGGGAMRSYSAKKAMGYVKRKDRPQNLCFLDHIRLFLWSSSSSHSDS